MVIIISQVPSGRPPSTSKTRHRLDVRWKRCTFLVVRGKIARNRNTPEHKTKDVIVLLAHTTLCTSHLLCIYYPHSFSKGKPTSLKISFTIYFLKLFFKVVLLLRLCWNISDNKILEFFLFDICVLNVITTVTNSWVKRLFLFSATPFLYKS